ncbi:hypothetical protein OBBRIDRAFT_888916 [Obba rivulosa]|uniref:Uncharacterized protein n=1 Tax=Obba rivulosa TaxID=1052685 RepID=A0A8E2DIW0_9APHY|nr:hypothetical protein OBBRIDRAFT_888916 [Obba rivulosa]
MPHPSPFIQAARTAKHQPASPYLREVFAGTASRTIVRGHYGSPTPGVLHAPPAPHAPRAFQAATHLTRLPIRPGELKATTRTARSHLGNSPPPSLSGVCEPRASPSMCGNADCRALGGRRCRRPWPADRTLPADTFAEERARPAAQHGPARAPDSRRRAACVVRRALLRPFSVRAGRAARAAISPYRQVLALRRAREAGQRDLDGGARKEAACAGVAPLSLRVVILDKGFQDTERERVCAVDVM